MANDQNGSVEMICSKCGRVGYQVDGDCSYCAERPCSVYSNGRVIGKLLTEDEAARLHATVLHQGKSAIISYE